VPCTRKSEEEYIVQGMSDMSRCLRVLSLPNKSFGDKDGSYFLSGFP
jgi:hypothetical protein